MSADYKVILYYKYISIEDPKDLVQSQRLLCEQLGLKGRIIIAHEGINGTLEGISEHIRAYIVSMKGDARFSDIHFKISDGTGDAFPRLTIKARKEIVTLGLPAEHDVDPTKTTGKYLAPEELYEWIRKSSDDFTIVDMRNDYEHKLGHFDGSVLPKMHNFRDLPKVVAELEPYKHKKIVTVCTGGVRCEKASGFLLQRGYKDVYQLHGGIVTYMEKYKNDDFKGKLYVFDNRLVMTHTDESKRTIVGRCDQCRRPSEHNANCAKPDCHKQIICCENCIQEKGDVFCNDVCAGYIS